MSLLLLLSRTGAAPAPSPSPAPPPVDVAVHGGGITYETKRQDTRLQNMAVIASVCALAASGVLQ